MGKKKQLSEDEKLYKDLQEKCEKLTPAQIEYLVHETLEQDTPAEVIKNLEKQKENKMSKIKELFGVEVGEAFDIERDNEIVKDYLFGCYGMLVTPTDTTHLRRLLLTGELITGKAKIIKHKQPILTEEERDYLQAVCEPYDIKYIKKETFDCKQKLYIDIYLKNGDTIPMPFFSPTSKMYKGMELNRPYIPEQLDIKKGD